MGYIIKNTSALINTRLTDVGRRKLSQGNFNISYFQVGDSELDYSIPSNYNQVNNSILMPAFNAQNDTGAPESNKQNVKYPFYVAGSSGTTYGIPFQDSAVQEVYNSAGSVGFFTSGGTVQTGSGYTKNAGYSVDMGSVGGLTTISLSSSACGTASDTTAVGDFITFFFDGTQGCGTFTNGPVLTYKIQSGGGTSVTLDRPLPFFPSGDARAYVYPSGMTPFYTSETPYTYWDQDVINFQTPCDTSYADPTLIWNMNIPWSENPAGLQFAMYEDYSYYGSIGYAGTKEYLGYTSDSGQTDTSETFYYNSFDDKVIVTPKEQKTIAIIHYTNQSIDNVYGEKFATVPFDPENPTDDTGLARHFKLSMPTLMWHKNSGATIGQDFYIDPTGYDLCYPYYIKSTKNLEMNDPGIRYFHLWDTNPDSNGNLNRIGKVFPDQEIVVIDDEEVVAALSYKSNRSWTLPSPKVSAIVPNTCAIGDEGVVGVLQYPTQRMWVTYVFSSDTFTNSLHCNYYNYVDGPQTGATYSTLDVAVRFGTEFPFMVPGTLGGFSAEYFQVLCQITTLDERPSPTAWRSIDFTGDISGMSGGYITQDGMAGTTFVITKTLYDAASASTYNLANYIAIPENGDTDLLNFGDEYFFYGNIQTDITATIYEMKYLVTLGRNQFTDSSNPTWTAGTPNYVSEIGLYDQDKDLIVISKLQSPQLRQAIQQFVVKLDF